METTENPHAIFEYCLPVSHNLDTVVAKKIKNKYDSGEMEVTDRVFESLQPVVFREAENCMHAVKVAMIATLGD